MRAKLRACCGMLAIGAGLLWPALGGAGQDDAARLEAAEVRWLLGVWPVVAYAKDSGLPLDIVVQPQPEPDAPPLALGFVGGRCKLVFSMRGNAEVPATLARVAPELLDATLELMAAHELGHCRRWLDGAWRGVPAGFVQRVPETLASAQREAWIAMQAARREEGYGDLVGLAWTRRHHPQHYARLHAWLLAERLRERVPGSPHDTLAWLRLVSHGEALDHGSIFDGAARWWAAGLAAGAE